MKIEISQIIVGDRYRMDYGDIDALSSSIATIGLLHPIVVSKDNRLICGARRLLACESLGLVEIEASIVDIEGEDELIAERDENETAKPFTVSERVEIGRAIEAAIGNRRGMRTDLADQLVQNFAQVPAGEKTREIAAKRAGFGNPETYRQAKVVVDKGAPELIEAVDEERIAVSTAAEIANAPAAQQKEIVAKGRDEIIREANRIKREEKIRKREERETKAAATITDMPRKSDRWQLIHAGVNALDLDPASVDVILTDPPYPREYLSVYGQLAETAARVLKPGGSCFVMIGQSYLPEILAAMTEHLTYQWTLGYLTPGGQAVQVWPRHVNTFWKPILWLVKGEYKGHWIGDVARSDVNDNDKRFHHWGQSESGMADLVRRCSEPGQTILDPFCGGGTTGIVAVDLGRFFIGSDVDENMISISASRLQEAEANAA